ncbi:hypothetical protein ABIE56_003710 [Luteibacter sp. 621]|uniref:hypothetical protein n=1 Tax=Luteibacter sp. 621 TaxID=3373916 RepID=UPI003D1AD787
MELRKLLARMVVWLMPAVAGVGMAADVADKAFTPDANVQRVAEAYAQDAVDYANKQFAIKLDGSDASIANVERALAKMRTSYVTTNPKPTDDQVMSFAKAFGSYIGEVYRRNHGAAWGIVNIGGQKYLGLKSAAGVSFWPWGRAFDRITKGDEANVADYYSALVAQGVKKVR